MSSSDVVPYDIVYCTSQDSQYPVTNLLGSSAASNTGDIITGGWQSARNGKVPQTLVLRFPGVVWLHQLRILSHESKIASKVEVRVFKLLSDNDIPEERELVDSPPSFRSARFTKLGSVEFNSNEHSQYRAKERKTVHLKTEAYFLKLMFDRPFANSMNPASQVGVYSIECIGHVMTPIDNHADTAVNGALPISSVPNDSSPWPAVASVSPARTDDTPPDGKLREPSTRVSTSAAAGSGGRTRQTTSRESAGALKISLPTREGDNEPGAGRRPEGPSALFASSGSAPFRSVRILEFEEFFLRRSEELLSLKEQAVAVDDFEMATECRDKLSELNLISRDIYKIENEKVEAIIGEDFEVAQRIRDRMNILVERAYSESKLPELEATPGAVIPAHPALGDDENGDGRRSSVSTDDCGNNADQLAVEKEGSLHSPGVETHSISDRDEEDAASDGAEPADMHAPQHLGNVPPPSGLPRGKRPDENTAPLSGVRARRESVDDTVVVPTQGGDDAVLRLTDIDCGVDSAGEREKTISEEILAASGEEGSGIVAQTAVNFDIRALNSSVGVFPTACLVSRQFKLREAALAVLTEHMHDHLAPVAAAVEDAVLRFLDYNSYGLQDPIPNVVFAACTFVRMSLADECGVLTVILPQATALIPRLLTRAADSLPRIRDEALTTLTQYVKTPSVPVAPYVTAVLADPLDKDRRKVPASNPRAQLARLNALQVLLESDRPSTGSESTTQAIVRKLLIPAVNHPNSDVRDLGISVFRKFADTQKHTFSEQELSRVSNPVIREAIISGKRSQPRRS